MHLPQADFRFMQFMLDFINHASVWRRLSGYFSLLCSANFKDGSWQVGCDVA